jgi:lipopolysaccharide transport system ATP-binding protein
MQGDPQSALASYHDLLRQRTETRAASLEGKTDLSPLATEKGVRQGTLEASITAVHFYDHEDQPLEKLESGQGLRLTLTYRITPSINDLALLVGIYNETHVKCFEVSISSMASTFGALSPEGTITCTIKSLPLLAGQYFMNVGLYPTDWSFIYDYHWQMHPFHIYRPERERAQLSGVVAIEATWSSLK